MMHKQKHRLRITSLLGGGGGDMDLLSCTYQYTSLTYTVYTLQMTVADGT